MAEHSLYSLFTLLSY